MKRLRFLVILVISLFIFDINVCAASGSLSVSSGSLYVGDSFTVTVNVEAAAWNIHVSASGPVNNCEINEVDVTEDAEDTSKTFSTTCTATGEGTITLNLIGDVTSASDGNAVNISDNKNITVSKKAESSNPVEDNDDSNDDNNENSDNVDNINKDDKDGTNDNKQEIAVFTTGDKEDEEISINSDTGDFTIILASFIAALFLGFIIYFILKINKDKPNNK